MKAKKFNIDYYCINIKGNLRPENQDNFFCEGKIRDIEDLLSDISFGGTITSEENKMLAVFDGMGGEACGEVASYIAAKETCRFCSENNIDDEYLVDLSSIINNSICQQRKQLDVSVMGTTSAMIQFNKREIYISNIGDSRIYKISAKEIIQVSCDHIPLGFMAAKPPLTQFLGISEAKHPLNPFVAKGDYRADEYFLLCSDGISDMVNEDEILSTVIISDSVEQGAKKLVQLALDNGGTDNITAILCKIYRDKVSKK